MDLGCWSGLWDLGIREFGFWIRDFGFGHVGFWNNPRRLGKPLRHLGRLSESGWRFVKRLRRCLVAFPKSLEASLWHFGVS